MAGNGVIGLELAEQLGELDAVLVPWGGGGLSTGIASALAAVSPGTRVVACEPATGAPFAASIAAGQRVDVDYTPSFVDGAGSKAVLPAMWERAQPLLAGAVAVPLDDVASAVRLLATRARVVAEGAGALALAAALAGHGGTGRVVCIVSGGTSTPTCSRRSSSPANRASAPRGSAAATNRLGDGEVHPLERKRDRVRHHGSSTSTCTTRASSAQRSNTRSSRTLR